MGNTLRRIFCCSTRDCEDDLQATLLPTEKPPLHPFGHRRLHTTMMTLAPAGIDGYDDELEI